MKLAWCFWEAGFYYELIEYWRKAEQQHKDARAGSSADSSAGIEPAAPDDWEPCWPGELVLDLDATEGRHAPVPSWLGEVPQSGHSPKW